MSHRNDEPPPLEDPRAAEARRLGLDRYPDVLAAFASGRAHAAHALLAKRLKTASSAQERRSIEAALADVRFYAEPVRKAPGLGRINGVGTGMYGRSDYDPADGTYVKTRFFSFVFVPVVPLDRWLVRDADGGWVFLARLPLSGPMKIGRIAVAIAAAIALVSAGFAAWWSGSHVTLHLLNGLDAPADVTMDDEPTVHLGPGGHEEMLIAEGRHHFRCTVAGRVIDERDETLSGGPGLAAYNVAGSAPLYLERVTYRSTSRATRDGAEDDAGMQFLGGRVVVRDRSVDYPFTAPPEQVSLRTSETSVVKMRAALAAGGWREAAAIAADEVGDRKLAAEIVHAAALAQIDDASVAALARKLSQDYAAPEAHAKFLDALKTAQSR